MTAYAKQGGSGIEAKVLAEVHKFRKCFVSKILYTTTSL